MTKVHKNPEIQQETEKNQVSIHLDVQQVIGMMQSLASALDFIDDYSDDRDSIHNRNRIGYLMQLNNLLGESLNQLEFEVTVNYNFNHQKVKSL